MDHLPPLEFTKDEECRLRKLFDHLDAEHKGFIVHEDLRRLCAELGREIPEERIDELIRRADPEHLGRIAWEPFVKAMAIVFAKLIVAVILVGAFKRLDVENTGFIARSELERLVVEAGIEIQKERLDEMIMKTNPGADGRIVFKEFVAAIVAHLRR